MQFYVKGWHLWYILPLTAASLPQGRRASVCYLVHQARVDVMMLVLCPFALLPVIYLGLRHGLFHRETGHSIGGFLGFTSPQFKDFKISHCGWRVTLVQTFWKTNVFEPSNSTLRTHNCRYVDYLAANICITELLLIANEMGKFNAKRLET